ncbi:MAG: transposase [Myxococcota bacterium]|jgi:transposase
MSAGKSKKRRSYTPEFKAEAVKLVLEEGLSQVKAARDLGIAESVLWRWLQKASAQESAKAVSAQATEKELMEEVSRLRRDLTVARKERDILKKAVAFFAKDVQ